MIELAGHFGRIQPDSRQAPGTRRLDPHVGAPEQAEQTVATRTGLHIDDGTTFVGIADGEVQAVVLVERRQPARRRPLRRLEPDHVGAEVGQEPAAQLCSVAGHVHHPQTREG